MHISSDESDEDKQESMDKTAAEGLKMNSHKLDGGMIRRSLFSHIEDEEQGYIVQDFKIPNPKVKKTIKYVGTIEHHKKETPSKKVVMQ